MCCVEWGNFQACSESLGQMSAWTTWTGEWTPGSSSSAGTSVSFVRRYATLAPILVVRQPAFGQTSEPRSPAFVQTSVLRSPQFAQTSVLRSPQFAQTSVLRSAQFAQTWELRSPAFAP